MMPKILVTAVSLFVTLALSSTHAQQAGQGLYVNAGDPSTPLSAFAAEKDITNARDLMNYYTEDGIDELTLAFAALSSRADSAKENSFLFGLMTMFLNSFDLKDEQEEAVNSVINNENSRLSFLKTSNEDNPLGLRGHVLIGSVLATASETHFRNNVDVGIDGVILEQTGDIGLKPRSESSCQLDPLPVVRVTLPLGKINSNTWSYNEQTHSGGFTIDRMEMNIYVGVMDPHPTEPGEQVLSWMLCESWETDWVIEVSKSEHGYVVQKRREHNPSKPDDDPFYPPLDRSGNVIDGPPKLGGHMTDQDNENSIWERELTHRLFAVGKDIKVKQITERLYRPNLEVIENIYKSGDSSDPRLNSSDESCIDIMFNGNHLPAISASYSEIPANPEQFKLFPRQAYCLGSCEHPFIQNSD